MNKLPCNLLYSIEYDHFFDDGRRTRHRKLNYWIGRHKAEQLQPYKKKQCRKTIPSAVFRETLVYSRFPRHMDVPAFSTSVKR